MARLDSLLERKKKLGDIGALDFLIDYERRSSTTRTKLLDPSGADDDADSRGLFIPAMLDIQYAQGPLPANETTQHEELVSIIIPSYNKEAWLGRAINSALSQQGVNCEILVVDDGSTDGSVALAQRIADRAPNVRVISLLRNFGCYYARNIGVRNSVGSYITIVDADDIMSPNRITRQLTAIKTSPGAVASRCSLRRWTENYSAAVRSLRLGEASLLWRRSILDAVGYYDTVRYGGDSEFRLRIEACYGHKAVIGMRDELYYARTLPDSLTTQSDSQAFVIEKQQLVANLSSPRRVYAERFTQWHNQVKPNHAQRSRGLHVTFPQLSRPFSLASRAQNASPSLGQRIVGAMTSYPPRREVLKTALETILPQVDILQLYLNEYDDPPPFVQHPKIRLVCSQDAEGDLRDNGKYYALPQDDGTYVFLFDDDIKYPNDYVAKMIHFIEMFGRSVVVGVHGIIFPPRNFTTLGQRAVYMYDTGFRGCFVDMIGTGTVAWHTSTMKLSLNDFKSKGLSDVWFALAAAHREVPLFSVPRAKNWLTTIERFDDCLWHETRADSATYFAIYNSILAPALSGGRVRRRMEDHLACGFDADTLAGAGVALNDRVAQKSLPAAPARRPVTQCHERRSELRIREPLSFHVVITGWNCLSYIDKCLRSVANQASGPFRYTVTLVDDGSTDGTYEKLAAAAILPSSNLIRVDYNKGPAHARHVGVRSITERNAIVVLLDMDDELLPDALKTVAKRYLANPQCRMTLGNWRDQDGKVNSQRFYTAEEIDNQSIRAVELFNGAPLRTFRRDLYDEITDSDLVDKNGNWLETCTDVAVTYPLLDQCWSWQVEFIPEPIYLYNRRHGTGTLARFGKSHKVARLGFLKSKPAKYRSPALSAHNVGVALKNNQTD